VLRRERLNTIEFQRVVNRIVDISREANIRLLTPGSESLESALSKTATFMKAQGLLDEDLPLQGLLDANFVKGGSEP